MRACNKKVDSGLSRSPSHAGLANLVVASASYTPDHYLSRPPCQTNMEPEKGLLVDCTIYHSL